MKEGHGVRVPARRPGFAGALTLATVLISCLGTGNKEEGESPVLEPLFAREVNKRDHRDLFCLQALDSYELAYRNADTLRIFFGRNTTDCGLPVVESSYARDSVKVSAEWPAPSCVDTPLYSYIELGYRILREGTVHVRLLADGSALSAVYDTTLATEEVILPAPCGAP